MIRHTNISGRLRIHCAPRLGHACLKTLMAMRSVVCLKPAIVTANVEPSVKGKADGSAPSEIVAERRSSAARPDLRLSQSWNRGSGQSRIMDPMNGPQPLGRASSPTGLWPHCRGVAYWPC
jgi:hypothetical protein